MEDFDDVFDAPDQNSLSLLLAPNTPSLFGTGHDALDQHQSMFLKDDVFGGGDGEVSSDEHKVDSCMDVDEDVEQMHMDEEQDTGSSSQQLQTGLDNNKDPFHEFQFRSYNLRPSSLRDGKAVWMTWLDTDESGNYDPRNPDAVDRIGRPSRPNRRRSRSRSNSVQHSRSYTDDEEEPRAAYLSKLAARQQGVSITVTFDLTTIAQQRVAAQIPDNWPGEGGHHNVLSDEHYKFLADQINARNGDWKSYNLRHRTISTASEDGDTETTLWLPDDRIADPIGEEVDLRNHPCARGCKACRELQIECSLLTHEFSWPCDTCVSDACECQLITPPIKRVICEHCRKKKVPCSNRRADSDPTQPCSECASLGFDCVAGPDPRYIRERISYDKDYTQQQPEDELVQDDRKYVTCTECRVAKKSCSLKSKFDFPPCESCEANGGTCTFEPLPRKPSNASLRQASSDTEEADGTHIISTALNHPVHFLHGATHECAWCTQAIGVFGRGMREVTVITSPDGLKHHEISGGQNMNGDRDDKMCISCTMERIRIISCREHELRPITDIPGNQDALQEMMLEMFNRIGEGRILPTDRWCAVCPSIATFQCCTPQEVDMWGDPITDPRSKAANGCGLLLCENCAVSYGELGNLESLVDAVKDEGGMPESIWSEGLRADAEFLKNDGLLVKNVVAPPSEPEVMVIDD